MAGPSKAQRIIFQDSIVLDILLQICQDPHPPTEIFSPSKLPYPDTCLLVSQRSHPHIAAAQTIAFLDSLEQQLETTLPPNAWLSPLHGLLIVDILASSLSQYQLISPTKKAAYSLQILNHYEESYQTFKTIDLKDKAVIINQVEWAALAADYGFVSVSVDSFPDAICLPSPLMRTTAPSYLGLLQHNQRAVEDCFRAALPKGVNPILYYALGGMLVGILITIVFHKIKKST